MVRSKLSHCCKKMSNAQNPYDIPLNPGWSIGIFKIADYNPYWHNLMTLYPLKTFMTFHVMLIGS